MYGWTDGKAVLRTAYSNNKYHDSFCKCPQNVLFLTFPVGSQLLNHQLVHYPEQKMVRSLKIGESLFAFELQGLQFNLPVMSTFTLATNYKSSQKEYVFIIFLFSIESKN